ncbi:MAG: hypothetical protein HGB11_15680 [Chlorobiales bacterium]|nr:hypothetical protein [Chlorobiales bacterium]
MLASLKQFFALDDAAAHDGREALGLEPQDPDWQRIGWNGVKPADAPAWERLLSKLKAVAVVRQVKGERNDRYI